MTVRAVTHLNFRGHAREALGFYHDVFGGDHMAITYREAGNVSDPDEADQLMWGQVVAKSGVRLMAYDVPSHIAWNPGEIPFFVSLQGDAADEIGDYWEKLAAGATIVQPLAPSNWAPLYGMLKDRFGVTWALNVAAEQVERRAA
jgi:PhnB protein